MEGRPCKVEKAKRQTDLDTALRLWRSVAVMNCKDRDSPFSHVTYVPVSVSVVCGHCKEGPDSRSSATCSRINIGAN